MKKTVFTILSSMIIIGSLSAGPADAGSWGPVQARGSKCPAGMRLPTAPDLIAGNKAGVLPNGIYLTEKALFRVNRGVLSKVTGGGVTQCIR